MICYLHSESASTDESTEEEEIELCTGFYPCSIDMTGDASTVVWPWAFSCNSANGCQDIVVRDVVAKCGSNVRNSSLFRVAGPVNIGIRNSSFSHCQFMAGRAGSEFISGDGSIIRAAQHAKITVKGSLFDSCIAEGHGGVFAIFGAHLNVVDSAFKDCQSTKGSGGAIWSDLYIALPSRAIPSVLVFSSCSFTNCVAKGAGGALSSSSGDFTVVGCSFDANVASSGGSMYISFASAFGSSSADRRVVVRGSSFTHNVASQTGGGAIHLKNLGAADSWVEQNIFRKNSAPKGGGGALLIEGEAIPRIILACGPGLFRNRSVHGPALCSPCEPGTFMETGGAYEVSNCSRCGKGTYQDSVGASHCLDCPSGSISKNLGASSHLTCVSCPSFSRSNAGGDKCFCNAGFGANPNGEFLSCQACAPGTYAEGKNTYAKGENCTQCMAGKYSEGPEAKSCTPCGAGKYSNSTGNDAATDCMACAEGTYSSITGASCTDEDPYNPNAGDPNAGDPNTGGGNFSFICVCLYI